MLVGHNPYRKLIAFINAQIKPEDVTCAGLCVTLIRARHSDYLDQNERATIYRAIDAALDRRYMPPFTFLTTAERWKHGEGYFRGNDHGLRMQWLQDQGNAWEDWVYPSPMFD